MPSLNTSISNRLTKSGAIAALLAVWLTVGAVPAGAAQDLGAPTTADARAAVPDFTLQDTAGSSHSLNDYRGKTLVVNFWATWCPPCIKEMPALQNAWQQLQADDIQVLGINMGETADDIDQFMQRVGLDVDFPLLLDENMAQGPLWSLKGLPTTYIVNPAGEIVYTVVGEREWDDPVILDQIRALQN